MFIPLPAMARMKAGPSWDSLDKYGREPTGFSTNREETAVPDKPDVVVQQRGPAGNGGDRQNCCQAKETHVSPSRAEEDSGNQPAVLPVQA